VLVHPEGGTVFRELKRDKTKLEPDQEEWGKALVASGADWDVWRPRDWPAVLAFLSLGRAGVPAAAVAPASGAQRR
jgi:hypothetical protein